MLEKFLRLSEVRNRVPYSRATIYRLISSGEFPRPYSLGARAVAWREAEISAWIEDRIAKHDEAGATTPSAVPEARR
jgi:prophage regulatory protein